MYKKIFAAFLIATLLVVMVGCVAHVHTVGAGPQGKGMETQRQWYVLWGLVPINEVDTAQMAAGVSDYEITTEFAPIDVLIDFFTAEVSIIARSVTVTK